MEDTVMRTMEPTYKCKIQVEDHGVYNASFLVITSPTGNSVKLKRALYPYTLPDSLWKTYAKIIYRKDWMTYLMLTRQDMENILEMQRRNIALRY